MALEWMLSIQDQVSLSDMSNRTVEFCESYFIVG